MWEGGPIAHWVDPAILGPGRYVFGPGEEEWVSVDLRPDADETGREREAAEWGRVAAMLRAAADSAGLLALLVRVPGGARPGDRVALHDPDSPCHGAEGVILDETTPDGQAIRIDWKGEKGRGLLLYDRWPERLRIVRRVNAPAGKGGDS